MTDEEHLTVQISPEIRTSFAIRERIDALSAQRTAHLRELNAGDEIRRHLLVSDASQADLLQQGAQMARLRTEIERVDLKIEALKAELPGIEAAEEQQRQKAVRAELTRMGERYREIIETAYPVACEPLIALLTELEVLDREIEASNKLVPGPLRVRPNDFRQNPRMQRSLGRLQETVVLPPVTQRDQSLWPVPREPFQRREVERAPVQIDEFGKPPIVNDARRADPGIIVSRVPLDVWMRERDARLKAEERARAEGAR